MFRWRAGLVIVGAASSSIVPVVPVDDFLKFNNAPGGSREPTCVKIRRRGGPVRDWQIPHALLALF
jgi:hypothetical protein